MFVVKLDDDALLRWQAHKMEIKIIYGDPLNENWVGLISTDLYCIRSPTSHSESEKSWLDILQTNSIQRLKRLFQLAGDVID